MAALNRRRAFLILGVMAGALALLLPASPASAQAGGPGAQATPVVGASPTANCPTPVPAAQVAGTFAAGPFTVGFPAGGSCTSFSADAEGSYTVGGFGPLPFTASCQTAGLQHGGGVFVPEGTVVNPGPGQTVVGAGGTTITTPNTPVRYPNGTVATLNVVTTTATTVTRSAIVSGGVIIGRVICGAANVYPLAVDTAAAGAPPVLPVGSDGGGGGLASGTLIAGAALALAVAAQLTIARRVRRRGDTTA